MQTRWCPGGSYALAEVDDESRRRKGTVDLRQHGPPGSLVSAK